MFLYQLHEFVNASLRPLWAVTKTVEDFFLKPLEAPLREIPGGRILAASYELMERSIRIFNKPAFNINQVRRYGSVVDIQEEEVACKSFCTLKRFIRHRDGKEVGINDPRILIVAPMAGHYATLQRDTVRAMLPHHNVYITDWQNARDVPLMLGNFALDTYIDYLLDFIRMLGRELHIIAVCQPSLPVLASVALLATYDEDCQPNSMILMGGPIDTRINPGAVDRFAKSRSLEWFKQNIISTVPVYYAGSGRRVCPGFIMLTGFMNLNLDRHQEATRQYFEHLVQGDEESADLHRKFYDEYRAVMDLPADYFLDSIYVAFQKHLLPRGKMTWRGYPIMLQSIQKTALMTVEGGLDDISCPGQTRASHRLCLSLPETRKQHHTQSNVGHFGIFNGRRWRQEIQPKVAEFIKNNRD